MRGHDPGLEQPRDREHPEQALRYDEHQQATAKETDTTAPAWYVSQLLQ